MRFGVELKAVFGFSFSFASVCHRCKQEVEGILSKFKEYEHRKSYKANWLAFMVILRLIQLWETSKRKISKESRRKQHEFFKKA